MSAGFCWMAHSVVMPMVVIPASGGNDNHTGAQQQKPLFRNARNLDGINKDLHFAGDADVPFAGHDRQHLARQPQRGQLLGLILVLLAIAQADVIIPAALVQSKGMGFIRNVGDPPFIFFRAFPTYFGSYPAAVKKL